MSLNPAACRPANAERPARAAWRGPAGGVSPQGAAPAPGGRDVTRFTWDHVHLRSPDPDRAAEAYVDLFAARVLDRAEADGRLRVTLDLGGQRVFIDRVPPGTAAAPPTPYVGVEHVGLAVDDLHAVAAELRRRGAVFTVEPHQPRPGVWIAFVQAPDGVQVEVLQRGAP